MANPNNAVGTNGAFGGRTSVNALNDVLATFTGAGVISGWAVAPSSGMTVQVGGQSGLRDVAIAEDNNGNRTTIDNISQAPVPVDIASAPSTNSRMDAIVGYVENPPQGSATVLDNPAACGIVAVSGTASSSPSAPTDSAIRTALTGLGINGATAYYAVLGYVTIPSGTTDIDATMISAVPYTNLNTANNIATGQISADKVDFTTINKTVKPLSENATSTSSNYTQTAFSGAVTFTFPSEVGAKYLITANGTFSTDKDSRQTIFALWEGGVQTGTRIDASSGSQTSANVWYSYEFIRSIYTATSDSTTLTLSCGCGGTNVKCTLVNNVVFNAQRTT